MALRTDYKDYIPPEEGRAYSITAESGGISRITDITEYEQAGDTWSAADINATNEAINANTANAEAALQATNTQNQLINTDCLINQRGVYYGAGYTYDRWYCSSQGMTVSTQANTSPSNAINEIVITKTGSGYFSQPLEVFDDNWVGRTITASVWLKADAGTLTASVGGLSKSIVHTGDWQLFQFTGTVTTHSTWYRKGFTIYSPSGTVSMSAPQVVYGSYIGTYQPAIYAQDLKLCQRFYYKTAGNRVFGYSAEGNATNYNNHIQLIFPTTMRTTPTISFAAGELDIRALGKALAATSLTTELFYGHGISLIATCTSAFGNSVAVSGRFGIGNPAAFDAEIYSTNP